MNQDSQQVNPKKLFIGNLPYSVTEQTLQETFSPFGEIVEVKLITDRMTGRSRGIAFIEFATEDQAQAAIQGMDNKELEGRVIAVKVAQPRPPREDRGGFGGGGGFRRDNRSGGDDRGGQRRDNFGRGPRY
jgi:RNA recognition motif-containing protein